MVTDREEQLEKALAQFIKPAKGIPFEVVVRGLCGADDTAHADEDGNDVEFMHEEHDRVTAFKCPTCSSKTLVYRTREKS